MKKSALMLVTHTIAIVVGLCIGWFGAAFELSGLFYESTQFKFPEQVLTEEPSPDRKFTARILYDKNTKNYFLSIEGRENNRLILTRKFVPNTAYHDPLVTLSWISSTTVQVSVDHDFGEGNLIYEFNINDMQLKKK